ncbi:MAG TPA: protein phosphatase 2C domain-containing protein [Longibacter sp.]
MDRSGPPVDVVAVSIPKQGSTPDENEDAFAVHADTFPVRVAVADGATESVYSRLWASCLTRRMVRVDDLTDTEWSRSVDAARNDWSATLADDPSPVPWYVEEKQREGAFATCLTLMLNADGAYSAFSVGDCILIHEKAGGRDAWPVDDPEAFSHRPGLLNSRSSDARPAPDIEHGTWTRGDVFILATDAVAAWLLDATPALPDDPACLRAQVEAARDNGALRNDDATLVRIQVAAKPS